ncbi:hypothetical protein M5585_27375 [Serratia ureilytica]
MYHWGDGTAWSGYQPRAFFARAGSSYSRRAKRHRSSWWNMSKTGCAG